MTPEIGLPSIIDAFLQALSFELASATSQIDCRNLPWSQIINKLVEIERPLPKKLAWKNPTHASVNIAQFHEAHSNKRKLDPNLNDRSDNCQKDK